MAGNWPHGSVEKPMNYRAREFLEQLIEMRDWRQAKLDEGRTNGRPISWTARELRALNWALNQLSALEEVWLSDDADESLTKRVDLLARHALRAEALRSALIRQMRDEQIGDLEDEERNNDE